MVVIAYLHGLQTCTLMTTTGVGKLACTAGAEHEERNKSASVKLYKMYKMGLCVIIGSLQLDYASVYVCVRVFKSTIICTVRSCF